MHTLARNLNLPASFVEIRHAATHEALPSLSVLRAVAVRALDWLWTNYWNVVGVATPTDSVGVANERVQLLRARLALKRWRQLRRDNPLRELKQGDSSPEGREVFGIIKECVVICKDEEGREALVDAFLEERALIPAGKKYVNIFSTLPGLSLTGAEPSGAELSDTDRTYRKSPLMSGAIHLWLPLLEAIDPSINGFADHLLTSMLDIFTYSQESPTRSTGSPVTNIYSSEFIEAILTWLQALTSTYTSSGSQITFGSHSSSPADLDELVKQCVLRPTEWFVSRYLFIRKSAVLILFP